MRRLNGSGRPDSHHTLRAIPPRIRKVSVTQAGIESHGARCVTFLGHSQGVLIAAIEAIHGILVALLGCTNFSHPCFSDHFSFERAHSSAGDVSRRSLNSKLGSVFRSSTLHGALVEFRQLPTSQHPDRHHLNRNP